MIRGLEHLSYEERLRVGVVRPGEEKAPGRPKCGLSTDKGGLQERWRQLFTKACSDRTRGNRPQLKEGEFRLANRRKFFMIKVVRQQNRLPREAADAPSRQVFEVRLDRALSNLI